MDTSTILAAGTDAIVPTIFRFPIALTGHIEIEGDMADEAMNTVGIDLRNALESDDAKSIDLDNGGVLSLTGFEIDGLPIAVAPRPQDTRGMDDPCTWADVEDWLSDAIGDSIDLDWAPRIAAQLIVARMKDGDFPVQFFAPEA